VCDYGWILWTDIIKAVFTGLRDKAPPPHRNAYLQNLQHFSISVQLKYWNFYSPEAFSGTHKCQKGVCGRGSARNPVERERESLRRSSDRLQGGGGHPLAFSNSIDAFSVWMWAARFNELPLTVFCLRPSRTSLLPYRVEWHALTARGPLTVKGCWRNVLNVSMMRLAYVL